MVLSLAVATIIVIPTIALIGISPIGDWAIGEAGSASWTANATFWSAYSAYGLPSMILIIVPTTFIVLAILFFVIWKMEKKEVM